jgi:predicted ATP-grasp superfamily ATP-dependent carboligase
MGSLEHTGAKSFVAALEVTMSPVGKTAVAITGFEGLDVSGPGLSIARALKAQSADTDILLALTSDEIASAGVMGEATDAVANLPSLLEGGSEAVDHIVGLSKAMPIRALIPGNNDHARIFAASAEKLGKSGIGTFLPSADAFERLTPQAMRDAFGDLPVEVMSSGTFVSVAAALACAEILSFPTMIMARGQRRVVWTASELRSHLQRLDKGAAAGVRAIPADFSAGYRLACLSENGEMGPLVITRILGNTAAGSVAASTVIHDPELKKLAARMVRALDWTGPLELELRRTVDTGLFRLQWAECSLPDWSMLTHWAGCNLAGALLKRIDSGRLAEMGTARPGTIAARCTYEMVMPEETHSTPTLNSIALHQPRVRPARHRDEDAASVAVTGLSVSDLINPGPGVSRALRSGTAVKQLIGIGYTALDAAAYDTLLYDRVFRFDFPRTAGSFRAQILNAAKAAPFDVLLPCLDDELLFAIAIADDLAAHGIATLLPTKEALERRSKPSLFDSDMERDWDAFLIPRSLVVNDEDDARQAARHFNGAAVAKGARYLCNVIRNPSEAAAAWRRLAGQDEDHRVIFQEQLDGPSYAVSVVCDRNHDVVSSLTIKKETLCPRGSTWGAVSVPEPELEKNFARLLRKIGWVGPAEGEFMLDRRNHRFHLIEINPRFTGWISASPAIGPNQPEIAMRLALGQAFKCTPPVPGRLFLRAADEVRVTASKLSDFTTRRTFKHEHA